MKLNLIDTRNATMPDLKKLFSLLDLNKNGRVETWEILVFLIGFLAAGVVLNTFLQ